MTEKRTLKTMKMYLNCMMENRVSPTRSSKMKDQFGSKKCTTDTQSVTGITEKSSDSILRVIGVKSVLPRNVDYLIKPSIIIG